MKTDDCYNNYELPNEGESVEKSVSQQKDIMAEIMPHIHNAFEQQPTEYEQVDVFLKDSSNPFFLKSCQIRVATNFVYFCEMKTKKELAVPIENIQYYICRRTGVEQERDKNKDE